MKKNFFSIITSLFILINILSLCNKNIAINNSDFPHFPISIYSEEPIDQDSSCPVSAKSKPLQNCNDKLYISKAVPTLQSAVHALVTQPLSHRLRGQTSPAPLVHYHISYIFIFHSVLQYTYHLLCRF